MQPQNQQMQEKLVGSHTQTHILFGRCSTNSHCDAIQHIFASKCIDRSRQQRKFLHICTPAESLCYTAMSQKNEFHGLLLNWTEVTLLALLETLRFQSSCCLTESLSIMTSDTPKSTFYIQTSEDFERVRVSCTLAMLLLAQSETSASHF